MCYCEKRQRKSLNDNKGPCCNTHRARYFKVLVFVMSSLVPISLPEESLIVSSWPNVRSIPLHISASVGHRSPSLTHSPNELQSCIAIETPASCAQPLQHQPNDPVQTRQPPPRPTRTLRRRSARCILFFAIYSLMLIRLIHPLPFHLSQGEAP